MEVAIYFKNGNTAYFKRVSDLNIAHKDISFNYFDENNQQEKEVLFFIDEIAGYSHSEEESVDEDKVVVYGYPIEEKR
ncbi:hypothetical protein I4Q36_06880 [Tuanshanicoccus lijuaniae]|uniref:hypothetical protein n=1 Tax=Aerococcaceae bacterium zg-1292 TaxID=2774330 RepID=UPI001938101C|nr:hypothetical protein [Aerococcaceae bacterium zg-1292]QQA36535.1 hypothetical protein I4Q36_06880 [Aerococcaceae bacterium zg-1292]